MKYPKMVIFDYGHTLLYEPGWDAAVGNAELLKYVTKNPNNCTLEDVRKAAELIYGNHMDNVRKMGYDVSGRIADKVLYEYLGIEFSLSPLERETVFWDGASAGAIMPGADKMIDYLNRKGIRTAVISNLLWSGEALKQRLDRLLPRNQFEFVMTSSDYFLRKPNRILFDIALQKAGLRGNEVWYCGDNPRCDVEGAFEAGIYPIWYDNPTEKNYKDRSNDRKPCCDHTYIRQWDEMIAMLEGLNEIKI